jgi:hypothetical protein
VDDKDKCREESNAGNQVPVRVSTKEMKTGASSFQLCDTAAENHLYYAGGDADGQSGNSPVRSYLTFDLPRLGDWGPLGWGTSGHGGA